MIFRFQPAIAARILCLSVLLLNACLPLCAQVPVFAQMPDNIIRYISAANADMPIQTSHDIAVIESNSPSYLASSDKAGRYYRLNRLIALEEKLLKPSSDLRRYWYEFVEAKAPALTESEIDAIAQDWWSANGFRAVEHDEAHGLQSASFKEVRAHLQIFRTGNEAQVVAAKQWLMMAQMAEGWDSFTIPPRMRDLSPLAHLLARDISEESRIYAGPESDKLRRTLKSLLVSKFTMQGEDGITRPISTNDVDALLDALSSDEGSRRASAVQPLEEWLKQAIDADIRRFAGK